MFGRWVVFSPVLKNNESIAKNRGFLLLVGSPALPGEAWCSSAGWYLHFSPLSSRSALMFLNLTCISGQIR